jgi:hypothetical protein
MQALAMHTFQPLDHFAAMAERLARSWGARIGTTHAEAFDLLPVLGRLPATRYLVTVSTPLQARSERLAATILNT